LSGSWKRSRRSGLQQRAIDVSRETFAVFAASIRNGIGCGGRKPQTRGWLQQRPINVSRETFAVIAASSRNGFWLLRLEATDT